MSGESLFCLQVKPLFSTGKAKTVFVVSFSMEQAIAAFKKTNSEESCYSIMGITEVADAANTYRNSAEEPQLIICEDV